MDQYVSVVPRLLPTQYTTKKIPISDEGYQYVDNHRMPSFVSPQGNLNNQQPLSTRTQLMNNDLNQPIYTNPIENSFKGRTSQARLHHEALKDNSSDQYPISLYPGYSYPNNGDYKPFDNTLKENSSINKSTKMIIMIFGIIIALFALTALAISIYLLIKISNTTTSG